ncbi:MAG: acetate--CoA ligase family protein [Gemmataceae bacterium]
MTTSNTEAVSRQIPLPTQGELQSGLLILRDGTTAQLRPVRPEDKDEVGRFFHGLSFASRRHRFFSVAEPDANVIRRITEARDPQTGLSLAVTRSVNGVPHVIALGSYFATRDAAAEVAVAVADEFLGKGLGTLLLERLARLASVSGFTRLWCQAAADDTAMLGVLHATGFVLSERMDHGVVHVSLDLTATPSSVGGEAARDAEATVASLVPFFKPSAIAVVGVSRTPGSVGRNVFERLLESGFTGAIHPVNPHTTEIAGAKCVASVRAIAGAVDLAIIAVPTSSVSGVVDDCAAKGVRAIVVLTAGFAESGSAGAALQDELLAKVRDNGMRMIGPNCLGMLNADPAVRMNATFAPVFPPSGRVAMSAQSGAVGLAAIQAAQRSGLGISSFVSVGNKADVSGNDLLQYWEADPATSVILLYLESFGNPRRFARIARRVGLGKPIIALHSGLTGAGRRAAGSHTAALASKAKSVDALFTQTGVLRVQSLEEMFDAALVLASQPLPAGRRVGIVTNAGGPAILCADACESNGLLVPELSHELKEKLAAFLPSGLHANNPLDLIAGASASAFRDALEAMLTSREVDAAIAIFTPVGLATQQDVTQAFGDALAAARGRGCTVPMLACIVGPAADRSELRFATENVPCFPFPEPAARALAKAAGYAEWRSKPRGEFPELKAIRPDEARTVCRTTLESRGPGWLSVEEVQRVLQSLGLPVVPTVVARTPDEAVCAAVNLGLPVTLKVSSRLLVHKSDVGGVKLNLKTVEEVRKAAGDIVAAIASEHGPEAMDGLVVQPMLGGGIELAAGVVRDPAFGPLIGFGLGGTLVEVLDDVVFRVAPLTDRDAAEQVRSIRGFKLLTGYRGRSPADLAAVENLLLRLSRLAEEVEEIDEIDLNPVFALEPGSGCRIADARIHVRPKPVSAARSVEPPK